MNDTPAGSRHLEEWLARLLFYGTLIACTAIAVGLVLSNMGIATAGIVLFIVLPTIRVLLMFLAFLRQRERYLALMAALVLAILALGVLLGLRTNASITHARFSPAIRLYEDSLMEKVQPQQEHVWLKKLIGNWTFESEASMGPDKPPMKSTGTETVRTVGGLWYIGEAQAPMPDGTQGTMIITLGYNPTTKRYVGTWIGSMMTQLWVYDGFIEGNTLNLDAEGPSMSGDGKMAKYRDSMEFVGDDQRILRSQVLGEDGKWSPPFMTAHYRRTA